MSLLTSVRSGVKNPTKAGQKPSQTVPRKFLGWLAQCRQSGPACPQISSATKFPFAPGVIEEPEVSDDGWFGWTIELAIVTIALSGAAALLGFACGYFSLPGWLL